MAVNNNIITVLIPTYRRPEMLKIALESALNQTVDKKFYKILVIDNDPTPNTKTENLVKSYNYENLSYIKNSQNLGGYGNWNEGFRLSKTEWVCLLHDDDCILPNCIERALWFLHKFETPSLGAIISRQCNWYDDVYEREMELKEQNKNWKAKLDHFLRKKTYKRMWKVSLFDNYMICSAYPALSGGNLIRRSAVIKLGGFGTKWPCEDIFFLNKMAMEYDCFIVGEQWGWYRFGNNNMWARPDDLIKWDKAKMLFREQVSKVDFKSCLYHKLFSTAMCEFDRLESIRFAKRRNIFVDPDKYTWLKNRKTLSIWQRICRLNRNLWQIWMSIRIYLFGIKFERKNENE